MTHHDPSLEDDTPRHRDNEMTHQDPSPENDTLKQQGSESYDHDPLTHRIIGCALEVHRHLGPGLMEATYEEALCLELTHERIPFIRQAGVPVYYKGHLIGEHRPDLVVQDRVVVGPSLTEELKVERERKPRCLGVS
jgi:GxxExxY protein